MTQTAQVVRQIQPGLVEIAVRRDSACAGDCGSCAGCSFAQGGQMLLTTAQDSLGAAPGDLVKVQSSTAQVLGAAVMLFLVPVFLFLAGYLAGSAAGWQNGASLLLGGAGFLAGLAGAVLLDRLGRRRRLFACRVVEILSPRHRV